ncbi:MAG: hypothetical protein AAF492_27480, partial [Verrucomicrobiota bacterium]
MEVRCPAHDLAREGFLVRPVDPIRHALLNELLHRPEQTLNRPVRFQQNGEELKTLHLNDEVNRIDLDRTTDVPFPDPTRLNLRTRNLRCYDHAEEDLNPILEKVLDLPSFETIRHRFKADWTEDQQVRFIHHAARRLYAAPFENVTKIDHALPFRTGPEVWANIAEGGGGICAEKTGALLFLCHLLDVETAPVIGAAEEIPEDLEAHYLAYASGDLKKRPFWIQHHFLEVRPGRRRLLIDVTNGNLPFLFREGDDVEHMLNGGYRGRMVYRSEKLHLKRATPLLGDLLLTLSEFHAPDLYFDYIFDQGLGLHIDRDLFVGVYFDWGGEQAARMERYYAANARKRRMPYPRFLHA